MQLLFVKYHEMLQLPLFSFQVSDCPENLTQFWLYLTPVLYPSGMVPPRFRAILWLNPMASVVEGFRWALLGLPRPPAALTRAERAEPPADQ